jgi:hypothetical protein
MEPEKWQETTPFSLNSTRYLSTVKLEHRSQACRLEARNLKSYAKEAQVQVFLLQLNPGADVWCSSIDPPDVAYLS